MRSVAFVQKTFQQYYNEDFSLDESFPMIESREFGFASFEGWMLRHRRFENKEELTSFLRTSAPRDVYSSCAYYEDPEAEMEKKGWLGADLIFDIDADHISTPCNKVHDEWACGDCGFVGKGNVPEKCPVCNSEKFDASTWPCEVCLSSAKTETVKLLDVLMKDFGFSEREVRVFFSGHRGYHVHVESETVKSLDAIARKETVDYICGLGFDAAYHGLDEKSWRMEHALRSLSLNNSGWRRRVAMGIYDFILNAKQEDYKSIGLRKNVIAAIMEKRDIILMNWGGRGFLGAVKGVGFETWKRIAEFCKKSQSVQVDTVVTTDVHRLIRLADTLHGRTGFKKVEFSISNLENFDPFKKAVTFRKGTATVFVSSAPEFRLGDEIFGPYKNQKIELPTAAAVMLVCKDRGEVIE